MLAFECDYLEGAHEKILNRLIETNMEKLPGYGADPYCASAREKILDACQCPEGEVFFLVGGTQTNATVIDGLLSSYEGVVSAETGHVNCHESGAHRGFRPIRSSHFPITKESWTRGSWKAF